MRTRLLVNLILITWMLNTSCAPSTEQAEDGVFTVAAKSGNRPASGDTEKDESPQTDDSSEAGAPAEMRQPAREGKSASNSVEVISFEDLNLGMQPDVVFRPWMVNENVNQLLDKRVRITGYMDPGVQQTSGFKDFILLKNTNCKFGPGGQADHLVWVKFKEGINASFTDKVVQVEGTLELRPYPGPDGNTWSVYDLHTDVFTARPKWRR